METYDFIFAGTGVAAILLLNELLNSELSNSRILLLDKTTKDHEDRTLSYWQSESSSVDKLVYRYWDKIQVVSDKLTKSDSILDYKYKCIRSIDLYRYMHELQANHPNISLVRANVIDILDTKDTVEAVTQDAVYKANYVFDSRFSNNELKSKSGRILTQNFKGWFIKTKDPSFQSTEMRMFDFRVPQNKDFKFCYLLPFSETEALVELVTLNHTDFDSTLKAYIDEVLQIKDYTITGTEGGVNLLTDIRFERKGIRVLKIGAAGGLIKPSSGYGFTRMQKDARNIVKSLITDGDPFSVTESTPFYRFCDSLMLKVLDSHPEMGEKIFSSMFRYNNTKSILNFLDEKATVWEIVRLMTFMYPLVFIKAMLRK